MANVKLKNSDEEQLYPQTLTSLVLDTDGNTLDSLLANLTTTEYVKAKIEEYFLENSSSTALTVSYTYESDTITSVSVDEDTFLTAVDNMAGEYIFNCRYVLESTADDADELNSQITDDEGNIDEPLIISASADTGVTVASSDYSKWYLNGTTYITLSDYGITYKGSANVDDTITVTVAEG